VAPPEFQPERFVAALLSCEFEQVGERLDSYDAIQIFDDRAIDAGAGPELRAV
jgi:hypothetical protein